MTYAKLINNFPTFAPNPILHNGLWHGNPPAEIYAAEGYKPVVYVEPPDPEPGFVVREYWEETEVMGDAVIAQMWITEPEPDEIPEDRAFRIITGEEE